MSSAKTNNFNHFNYLSFYNNWAEVLRQKYYLILNRLL